MQRSLLFQHAKTIPPWPQQSTRQLYSCKRSVKLAQTVTSSLYLRLSTLLALRALVNFLPAQDNVFSGDAAPVTEATLPAPVNVYGKTKLQFEEQLREFWPRHTTFRSSNIIGPQPPYRALPAAKFLQWLDTALGSDSEQTTLFSDERRSFVSVNDITRVVCAAATTALQLAAPPAPPLIPGPPAPPRAAVAPAPPAPGPLLPWTVRRTLHHQ